MKQFKGKVLYNPSGKAGEYSYWAANLFVGCSNGCTYCYCKKGILAGAMGQDKPTLKKGMVDYLHVEQTFHRELLKNKEELQKYGIFFSFSTDPMLDEVKEVTMACIGLALRYNIPVKVLTKCAGWVESYVDWIENSNSDNKDRKWRRMIAWGFTLTGHDELEPNASPNMERINAMKILHEAGFLTFASIEPILDFNSSLDMIWNIRNCCNLVKIGLLSGKKYDENKLRDFMSKCIFWGEGERMAAVDGLNFRGFKIYFKDSLLKQAGKDRSKLPSICVGRDFNLFK